MRQLYAETPGEFAVLALEGKIPCRCGKTLLGLDAYNGHRAHCDQGLDTSHDGQVRAGIAIPFEERLPEGITLDPPTRSDHVTSTE